MAASSLHGSAGGFPLANSIEVRNLDVSVALISGTPNVALRVFQVGQILERSALAVRPKLGHSAFTLSANSGSTKHEPPLPMAFSHSVALE